MLEFPANIGGTIVEASTDQMNDDTLMREA